MMEVNGPLGKKINLSEVKRIRKFAGDYRLQTGEKELVINTLYIDTESRTELTEKLEKLTAVWY